jgi:catechol 2,3-dioxygenase-like lactoylglutathione lyase family enzyme
MMTPTAKEALMYDHIELKVKDLEASASFYKAARAPLGYEAESGDPSGVAGFSAADGSTFWLRAGKASGPLHIAFRTAEHKAVDRFHSAGKAAGGRDNGKPGIRKNYSPTYYAAFLIDPDGNNIEAVCTS